MRSKCASLLLFMTVGLTPTHSVLAQGFASDNSRGPDSNPKPCVAVFGAVRSPARIKLWRGERLAEVIAAAGGLSERAGRTIQIVHSGSDPTCYQASRENKVNRPAQVTVEVYDLQGLLRGDARANPYLQPGDIVIVPERPPVYVMGNIKRPQSIFPKARLTLTQAIEIGGGASPGSKTEEVKIYRSMPGSRSIVFTFDLKAIEKHQVEDPVLQPYDIIEVPGKTGGHSLPMAPPMVDPPMKLGIPLRVIA